ncbi:MAG: IS66 family transposase zinc-finger binding domain-containing protein [Chloroflexota bacterium]
MNDQRDLSTASREELLAIIAEQHVINAELRTTVGSLQAIIEELLRRIACLEACVGGKGSGGPPDNKPANAKPRRDRKPRKPRPQGFARRRMAPTCEVEHALNECPGCGTRLLAGWVQRTREVIDLPLPAVEVTEHRYIARVCPLCRKRQLPKANLGGVVVGQQCWASTWSA